ncbi:hairy-related 5 [Anoplopoma fimbria]|uniref:hairy-related 5 n=1 Tax=Anoplopoma fimbria TaxID=229290 RepID=UPI0023EB5AF5|nr:hairy-related 5 [Anoplopoma fimbria]
MKALSSPEAHTPRSLRRVPKPLMEKRRRERINQSLETLRLLMLDNTHNEKLKNPKVEKAEILESVINFLQTEKDGEMEMEPRSRSRSRSRSRAQRPKSARQHSYHDGMRSCLLRVSHFIASKSQDLEHTDGDQAAQASLPELQTHPSSPGHLHLAQAAPSPQHQAHQHCQSGISPPTLSRRTDLHCDTRELLSSLAACTHVPDPVWRPWPQ